MNLIRPISAAWRRIRCRSSSFNHQNVILTGVPRSGSTLACHLLNRLPNVVALHEPMKKWELEKDRAVDEMCDRIDCFFLRTRKSLERTGQAPSKHRSGAVPDNHVLDQRDGAGRRITEVELGMVYFGKGFDSSTLLVLKQPIAFSPILAGLRQRFPTYATVRNPLSILGSWASVNMQVSEGRAPIAEALSEDLRRRLAAISDREERRLSLLSWFFEQYRKHLPDDSVLRYEDIIASGGKSLSAIAPIANDLDEDLQSRNRSENYDRDMMSRSAERMLRMTDAGWWHYYSVQDIQSIASAFAK